MMCVFSCGEADLCRVPAYLNEGLTVRLLPADRGVQSEQRNDLCEKRGHFKYSHGGGPTALNVYIEF